MIKIENDEVVFDDGRIKLVQLCGIYVIFREIVFCLNNGSFMIEKCLDKKYLKNRWDYLCRKLKSNPNFFKVEDMDVIVNVSELQSIKQSCKENGKYKSFGLKLIYSNQEIGIWNRSKPLIDKCYSDLKKEMIQFGINEEKNNEKEQ